MLSFCSYKNRVMLRKEPSIQTPCYLFDRTQGQGVLDVYLAFCLALCCFAPPVCTRRWTRLPMCSTMQMATSMVSCETYESCFASSNLGGMASCLNGETHGPVHILTGGQWLNPDEDFIRKVGELYHVVSRGNCFSLRLNFLSTTVMTQWLPPPPPSRSRLYFC